MIRRAAAPMVLLAALLLAACTSPDPNAQPTMPDDPGSTASPSDSPDEPGEPGEGDEPAPMPVSLPDCAGLFSAALQTELTEEGRTSEGDTASAGAGGWGSGDPTIVGAIQSAAERVSCTWILPVSSSGSTTTVVRISDEASTALQTHLEDVAGFDVSTVGDATLYTLEVDGDFPYSEAHLFGGGVLIASEYFNGDAEVLTRDAASVLLAP